MQSGGQKTTHTRTHTHSGAELEPNFLGQVLVTFLY